MKLSMRHAAEPDISSKHPDRVESGTCLGASGSSVRLLLGVVLALFLSIAGAAGSAHADGTTYYVDLTGNDSNGGTSASSPWQTIDRVNALDLTPGDRVLIKGGQTFAGNLRLGAEDAGTATSPVVIGSYGEGKATISAGTGEGVSVYNAGGIEVRDLIVTGVGYAAGNRGSGVEVYTDLGGTTKLEHIRVDNVEASGFGGSGVLLGAYPEDGTKSGFVDVRIEDASAHDNADAGIQSFGYFSDSASGWAHEDVYVGHCQAYNNLGIPGKGNNSGSGVVLGDVNGATIERCVAHDNGENNDHQGGGPIGIWAWESNAVTIQHNESYDNKTGTIDGGGFDLDGGVTNSVMQYNYSHDNAGAGYLLYQFTGARPFKNNVVRYNISENDGRTNLGGITAGGGVADTDLHNNTIYISPRSDGGLPAAVQAYGTSDFRFLNNLFVTTGDAPLVTVHYEQSSLTFQGSNYWSSDGKFAIEHGGTTYASIGTWRSATGQETNGSKSTGSSVDPKLANPGNGGNIGNADSLSTLEAYKLQSDSPMIDAALDLRSLFNLNSGTLDFYGTSISQVTSYDIGAHEVTTPASEPPTVTNVSPAHSATSVVRNTNLTSSFSEEMNPETLTAGTVQLKQKQWYKVRKRVRGKIRRVWRYRWVPVTADVRCDQTPSPCTTATLDPSSDLLANTTYWATVTTGAKDKAGNALAQNYSWTFTTGSS